MSEDDLDYTSPLDAPALQPAAPVAPVAPPPSPRGEALRASLLKKPLDATLGASSSHAPASPPGYPSRYR